MRIKTKLYLVFLLYLVLLLLIGNTLNSSAKKSVASLEELEVSGEIVQQLALLNMLTQDYLLQPTQRARTQWQIVFDTLGDSIEQYSDREKGQQQAANTLKAFQGDIKFIENRFSKIIQPGISLEMRDKLQFQIVMKSREITVKAFELSKASREALLRAQRRGNTYSLVFLSAMFILVLVGFFSFVYPVLASIKKLSEGSELIGKGDFRHRIDITSRDEISDLAATFNTMTENLEKITASRDELNKEIIERKTAEKAAQEQKDFSDSLINSLPGIFYFFDETGQFLRWNKNFERIIGYSAEEIGDISPLDLFEGEDRESVHQSITEVFTSGEAGVEAYLVSKTGTRTPYYFTGLRIQQKTRTYLIGVGLDITDRKRAEETLREQEKLQGVLEMAGAICHELNQPLQIVSGFSKLLMMDVKDNDPKYETVEKIDNNINRMASLMRKVMGITHYQSKPYLKSKIVDIEQASRHELGDDFP